MTEVSLVVLVIIWWSSIEMVNGFWSLDIRLIYPCNRHCELLFFFFQAEDGIRDLTVTGVQTCALPIFLLAFLHRAGGSGRHRAETRAEPAGRADRRDRALRAAAAGRGRDRSQEHDRAHPGAHRDFDHLGELDHGAHPRHRHGW